MSTYEGVDAEPQISEREKSHKSFFAAMDPVMDTLIANMEFSQKLLQDNQVLTEAIKKAGFKTPTTEKEWWDLANKVQEVSGMALDNANERVVELVSLFPKSVV